MKIFHSSKGSWIIILVMALIGLTYPLISPYEAGDFSFDSLVSPSFDHLLGTMKWAMISYPCSSSASGYR